VIPSTTTVASWASSAAFQGHFPRAEIPGVGSHDDAQRLGALKRLHHLDQVRRARPAPDDQVRRATAT
jgi:hypothetical protein